MRKGEAIRCSRNKISHFTDFCPSSPTFLPEFCWVKHTGDSAPTHNPVSCETLSHRLLYIRDLLFSTLQKNCVCLPSFLRIPISESAFRTKQGNNQKYQHLSQSGLSLAAGEGPAEHGAEAPRPAGGIGHPGLLPLAPAPSFGRETGSSLPPPSNAAGSTHRTPGPSSEPALPSRYFSKGSACQRLQFCTSHTE